LTLTCAPDPRESVLFFLFVSHLWRSVWPRPDCALHPQSQCPNGTNPGRTYRFFTGHPVVPFGFGLSYTSFTYSWSAAPKEGVVLPNYFSAAMFPSLASLSAPLLSYQVRVTNTGSRDAADVVLGFLVPPGAGQNGLPLKVLFGFERVFVPAGQSVTVFLYPQLKDVLFVDAKGRREVLRGRYAVHVGIPELPSQHLVATLDAN
jgi:beta-D-xylosidase 4